MPCGPSCFDNSASNACSPSRPCSPLSMMLSMKRIVGQSWSMTESDSELGGLPLSQSL